MSVDKNILICRLGDILRPADVVDCLSELWHNTVQPLDQLIGPPGAWLTALTS